MMEVSYTSCACNRTPHSTSWSSSGKIVYAACSAIGVCSSTAHVDELCVGHTGRVNAVRWIRSSSLVPEKEFISVSTDKSARVWHFNTQLKKHETVAILKGHENTVTIADGVTIATADRSACRTVVVTASVDSTVKIWQRLKDNGGFTCTQTLSFGSGFALDVALHVLPGSLGPILACGGDDHKIHVYVEQDNQFIKVQSLLGHEDWIRALEFTTDDNGDLLLASGSQDTYIRIHRLASRDPDQIRHLAADISTLGLGEDIKMKENAFFFTSNEKEYCYAVTLESVLQGHENWVYSVHWQPKQVKGEVLHQPMCLLSASMDKTMILWAPETESGLWTEKFLDSYDRVHLTLSCGKLQSDRILSQLVAAIILKLAAVRVGEVGGNSLGFYGGVFGPDGNTIMAHGYQGAFQKWTYQTENESWEAQVTCGGHFDSVQDVAWQRGSADFLLSLSLDQTTRCHGYWKSLANENESGWYEVARPQIHGYDMQCLAVLDKYSFVSGADEKVMRVFAAPRNFVHNLASISALDLSADPGSRALPEGASVPALGLSNKAVYDTELKTSQQQPENEIQPSSHYPEVYFTPQTLQQPPDEVNLLQNTLWPEVQKLYGHGYEIYSVACHPEGTILASACKASKAEHACILLWDCKAWRQIASLVSHSLTVTQMAFSHDGKHLLSVSRDRTWTLFQARADGKPETDPLYSRIAGTDKKTAMHSRIIWACAWSHDDAIFVTVSRDKKALLWSRGEGTGEGGSPLAGYACCCAPLDLGHPVTAVDFAPCSLPGGRYILAFGLESGVIMLYTWDPSLGNSREAWKKCHHLEQSTAHHLTVKRLQFRPRVGRVGTKDTDSQYVQLASCGADHIVRVYTIDLTQCS